MRRELRGAAPVLALSLAVACCLALVGCGDDGQTADSGDGSTTSTPTAVSGRPAEGLEPIAVDGPGEAAAKAGLPRALEVAEQDRAAAGHAWPDLEGAEPVLEAYLVRVTMGDEVALLEVQADGTPHNLHASQKAFDAGSLVWVPKENVKGTTASTQSEAQKRAIAAVEGVMTDAFPDEDVAVAIHGYRFVYVKDDMILLTIEIDPEGELISAGN